MASMAMREFLSLRDGGRAEPEVDHSRTLPDKDLTPARSVYPQGDENNIVANSTSYQTLSTADTADWISTVGETCRFFAGSLRKPSRRPFLEQQRTLLEGSQLCRTGACAAYRLFVCRAAFASASRPRHNISPSRLYAAQRWSRGQ